MITPSGPAIRLIIDEPSLPGEVRRTAMAMAGRVGFDETGRGKVALVATEAATNLAKYAPGGEILLQALEWGSLGGMDILSVDRGPGMADVARCLADGHSTSGSPGTGLGAMGRLADDFDIYSRPGEGTVLLARLWSGPPTEARRDSSPEFGGVNLPLEREEVCGDSWAISRFEGRDFVLVVDGLGHGPLAAEAAREAVRVFQSRGWAGPGEVIHAAHAFLRSTRGAALAVAMVDRERGQVHFSGVGNIGGLILDPAEGRRTSMVSHNGTVGHVVRKVQEFVYPWSRGSLLVMSSDGLGTRWDLEQYAGLAMHHPGLVAGVLYRDFHRSRDDVTVVVAREDGRNPP